jgi:hypothetical protein
MAQGLRTWVQQAMQAAAEALRPAEAAAAWSQGTAMPIDQVIEEALAEAGCSTG